MLQIVKNYSSCLYFASPTKIRNPNSNKSKILYQVINTERESKCEAKTIPPTLQNLLTKFGPCIFAGICPMINLNNIRPSRKWLEKIYSIIYTRHKSKNLIHNKTLEKNRLMVPLSLVMLDSRNFYSFALVTWYSN